MPVGAGSNQSIFVSYNTSPDPAYEIFLSYKLNKIQLPIDLNIINIYFWICKM